jgi:hypothetical protein
MVGQQRKDELEDSVSQLEVRVRDIVEANVKNGKWQRLSDPRNLAANAEKKGSIVRIQ